MARRSDWRLAAVFVLGISVVLLPACTPDEIDDFVNENMHPETNVDYADEGRIFVLHNHCLEFTDEEDYQACSLVPPGEVPGSITEFDKTQVDQALPYVRRYRWITVNPSFTSVDSAKVVAAVQLKIMRWPGVVLVYLPQGPDKTRVDYSDWDSREDEVNRYLCGGFRTDHVDFREVLHALVDGATQPDPQGLAPAERLVVTAYSYSGPQTLRVVSENTNVFFFNVAPSFGWQKWAGDEDYELPWAALNSCIPQSDWASYHAMEIMNPAVDIYLDNLATAQVPQCLLTSYADCLSLGYHGSALTDPATEWPPTLTVPCGDPWNDPEAEYNPNNPAFSPWCAAPPDYEGEYQYIGGDFRLEESWEWPSSEPTEVCYLYGNDYDVIAAIQANLQTGDTIRMVTVETPSAADDQTFDKSLTDTYGEEQPTGHMGYWTSGPPPPFQTPPLDIERVTANWHVRGYLQQCPGLFVPEDCPACPDAEDWVNGDYGPGTWIYWEQDPRTATDPPQSHPENDLRSNDVIYVPMNGDLPPSGGGGFNDAVAELRDKWGILVAGESGHVSAIHNEVNLQFRTVPPAARRVSNIEFRIDGVPLGTVGGTTCSTTTPQTTHPKSWSVPDLFAPGGEYRDLAGAWFDVSTNWWDDSDMDECGDYDHDYTSGYRRVLVMKLDVSSQPAPGEFFDAFSAPVPDVRDAAFPPLDACSEGPVATQIYVHPASTLDLVEAEVTTPSGTTTLPGTNYFVICENGNCAIYGWNLGYTFNWNLHDAWCAEYPEDTLCGGVEYNETPVQVGFRVRATNTEGNHFYRDYEVELERGPDGDADGYPDGCDNCPEDSNPDQADFDGDSEGDACDTDDDNDGVLDVDDDCPLEDATGSDADVDGCIDTFDGMTDLIGELIESGALSGLLETSLTSKIDNAARAAARGSVCAAVNQLQALQREIRAQRGKEIPAETADLLLAYAQNLIDRLLNTVAGMECR